MKEKILLNALYIAGVLCFLIYMGSRFLPLMNTMLVEKMDLELKEFTSYGDLYYNNCIKHFKEDYPEQIRRYRLSDDNPRLSEAGILSFGDSFFDVSFQKTLPERLSDSTDWSVYSYITQDPSQSNPFCILNSSDLEWSDTPRVILFETVERNLPKKFSEPFTSDCSGPYVKYDDFGSKLLHEYIFKSSDELLFDLMLKRSLLTHRVYSTFSTLRFDLFGTISSKTPEYTVSPEPWLFYSNSIDDGPGSYYYNHSLSEIRNYASNIAHLSALLKSEYNLEMVFMLIPNKYTLYHRVVNDNPYNGFIQKLQEELDKQGVQYVDLFSAFEASEQILYYGTDTHWNKKGVDLALNITLEKIKQVLGNESSFNDDKQPK